MKKVTQEQQVIEVLREAGGYATLRRLNELVDFSSWATKTPEASVRRIVQKSPEIFTRFQDDGKAQRIRSGSNIGSYRKTA